MPIEQFRIEAYATAAICILNKSHFHGERDNVVPGLDARYLASDHRALLVKVRISTCVYVTIARNNRNS